jgi:hypothetical protein
MIRNLFFIGLFAGFLGLNSCETEFSLNGEYTLTPVVFGLLDPLDSIHTVKITKAFLGDGNNLEYAKIDDSSYFAQVEAQVIEFNEDGDATGRKWQLKDSIVEGKSTDGIFYSPNQKVYYFEEKALVTSYTYKIEADLNEGQMSFTATTTLIDGFELKGAIVSNPLFKVPFAKNTVEDDEDYLNWNVSIEPGTNAARYELAYSLNWTEFYDDGTDESFSMRRVETIESADKEVNLISGLDFFRWVGENIADDPKVIRRTYGGIDLHVSVAHKTLDTYMQVSKPVTGIAQIQPLYTNIDGGFGLFSSRVLYTKKGVNLDDASIKELATGSYTNTKLFCSDRPIHIGETFYCD